MIYNDKLIPFILRFFDSNIDPYIKQSIKSKLSDISDKSTIALQSVLHNQYHEIDACISTPIIILPGINDSYSLTAGNIEIKSLKSTTDNDQYSHFLFKLLGTSAMVLT